MTNTTETLAATSKRFNARPMLCAGVQCSSSDVKLRGRSVNEQQNAGGSFRRITSLGSVGQAGWNAADNLIKNFPFGV